MLMPTYEWDTFTYTHHACVRTAGYPLLIDLFRALFGSGWDWWLAGFQTLFALVCAFLLVRSAYRRFGLHRWSAFAAFAVLSYPLLSWQSGFSILPEAVSYGIFLLCAREMVELICGGGNFLLLSALAALNILFRPQTAFFVPLICVTGLWLFRRDRPRLLAACIIPPLAVSMALGVELLYQHHFNGVYSKAKLTGIHMAASMLYLSDPGDLSVFSDTPYYKPMQAIFSGMSSKGLFLEDAKDFRLAAPEKLYRPLSSPAHFSSGQLPHADQVFNEIAWYTVVPELYSGITGKEYVETRAFSDGRTWELMEAEGRQIFMRLGRLHFDRFLRHTAIEFFGEINFLLFLSCIILLLTPLYYPCGAAALFASFAAAVVLCNLGMVALFAIVLPRYVLPTYALAVFSLIPIIDRRVRELRGQAR